MKNKSEHMRDYSRTDMQRDRILQCLRERGCRITKQRQILLDVILKEECTSCKEIYYQAASIDPSIGAATVYRMMNLLEEIGAINRKNMYRICCDGNCDECIIELDDQSICRLSRKEWHQVISEGLKSCGYVDAQKVASVVSAAQL